MPERTRQSIDALTSSSFSIVSRQTLEGIGAAQGLARHEGYVYVYGDAETGVIRQYEFVDSEGAPSLSYTGVELLLTVDGEDLIPHPTGLTFHPSIGCLIGNTVGGVGTIRLIDFEKLLEQRTLDDAVLHTIDDDAAINGTRPEFVNVLGMPAIATGDYGEETDQIRLYDPNQLVRETKTSDVQTMTLNVSGGLFQFTQSMHWMDDKKTLVLAQNQTPGLGYRLLFVSAEFSLRGFPPKLYVDKYEFVQVDLSEPTDELEGFLHLRDDLALMVSAMREDNATFVRIDPPIE